MDSASMDGLKTAGRIARLMLALILMGIAMEGTLFSPAAIMASGPQCSEPEKTHTWCLTYEATSEPISFCLTPALCATCEYAVGEFCNSESGGQEEDAQEWQG